MGHSKEALARVLNAIDFGSSVAETDTLLENARVETSVFLDLLNDKVDLIPGTKGSGKSALYRIFVDFLQPRLLEHRRIVVAHGVQHHGDDVFQVYNNRFEKMDEHAFVDFWCVYLVSLANEHFVKEPKYTSFLKRASKQIQAFRQRCQSAQIPDFDTPKPLRAVIGWALEIVSFWRPKLKYRPAAGGEFELDMLGGEFKKRPEPEPEKEGASLPNYIHAIKDSLESVLKESDLSLWLMIDRLDEIFPRRSPLETRALRGLLRTLRIFESQWIRVKVFLRDDILEQVVSGPEGFTALTHVLGRKSDTLRWTEDQILTMIIKRLYANLSVREYLKVSQERIDASADYRREAFYKVFPRTVAHGERQSPTLRWIYQHTEDGQGAVTPRDVIELLTKAKQRQVDEFKSSPYGESDFVIGASAIKHGLRELSKSKRSTFLKAEFPHLWDYIEKFVGGRTEYSETKLRQLFGRNWESARKDLVSVGVLREEKRRNGPPSFKIPFLYREGLEVTQGRAK